MKKTFTASIDEYGTLRVDMVNIRSFCNKYRDKKATITIDVDEAI